jgi:hypothetical protein
MLAGKAVCKTSNQAAGCTFSSESHVIEPKPMDPISAKPIKSAAKKYRVWDTAGLNEGDNGNVPTREAFEKLSNLVQERGVNLLVFCMRGPRLKEISRVNYDLFWGIVCQGKVPIMVVVTGLEEEEIMDQWWDRNKTEFERRGMEFKEHACVTTTKGKLNKEGKHLLEREYSESQRKVWHLIEKCYNPEPWQADGGKWIDEVRNKTDEYMRRYNMRTGTERKLLPTTASDRAFLARLGQWILDHYPKRVKPAKRSSTTMSEEP